MRSADRAAEVAAEWIAKAENDLLNAAHTLKLGARCPTDTVCFTHSNREVPQRRRAERGALIRPAGTIARRARDRSRPILGDPPGTALWYGSIAIGWVSTPEYARGKFDFGRWLRHGTNHHSPQRSRVRHGHEGVDGDAARVLHESADHLDY